MRNVKLIAGLCYAYEPAEGVVVTSPMGDAIFTYGGNEKLSSTAPLKLGCPAMFSDRWEGRLAALEISADWEVLNVTVTRTRLGRPVSVRLPFSAAAAWSENHIAFTCSSDQAFERQVPPVAAPARPLSTATPVALAGAVLSGAIVDTRRRTVAALLLRLGHEERRLLPQDAAFDGKLLRVQVQPDTLSVWVSDEELVRRVIAALSDRRVLAPEDRRTLSVKASDGAVRLEGNVRTRDASRRAAMAAAAVRGVLRVDNAITDDASLEIELGRLLDAAGLQRAARLFVRSAWGEVTLLGHATSPRAVEEAVRLLSAQPGVRSVKSLVQTGQTPEAMAA